MKFPHLSALVEIDPLLRRQALENILIAEQLPYTIQEKGPEFNLPLGIKNYLIDAPADAFQPSPSLLLCAHYDAFPGSMGANDNAAGIAILLELTKVLRNRKINHRIAFFDGEESKQAGSKFFVKEGMDHAVNGVINLELCGFGDSMIFTLRGRTRKSPLELFDNRKFIKSQNAIRLKHMPTGDDASFRNKYPIVSLAMVPYWDVQYLKAMANLGSALGRPPEYYQILSEMEVATTMHGGYRDSLEYIDEGAMSRVYDFLLNLFHVPGST